MNIKNIQHNLNRTAATEAESQPVLDEANSSQRATHALVSKDSYKAAWGQLHKTRVPHRVGAPQTPPTGPEQTAILQAQKSFQDQFGKLASDKNKFHSLMKEVYGANYDATAAEGFRQRAVKGDYSWLPKIEFKSDAVLRGGNGAYDSSRNVVYINDKYVQDPARAAKVYAEEVGHFLDTKLNKTDTPGDEGELFRKLLAGKNYPRLRRRPFAQTTIMESSTSMARGPKLNSPSSTTLARASRKVGMPLRMVRKRQAKRLVMWQQVQPMPSPEALKLSPTDSRA
jgi:hypothetical protein